MYSDPGTAIVLSQQNFGLTYDATRMTSTTAVTVAAGDPAGLGPYRKQRLVSVFNSFVGALDANGTHIPGSSVLNVSTNDQHGVGPWFHRVISPPPPLGSTIITLTGMPDISATAWLHQTQAALMPLSTISVVSEATARTPDFDHPGQFFTRTKLVSVRSNDSGSSWQPFQELPRSTGSYDPDVHRPTVTIAEDHVPRVIIAFVGNRHRLDVENHIKPSIGIVHALAEDAEWHFSFARPGLDSAIHADPTADNRIYTGLDRVILRSNRLIGPYLVADIQMKREPAEIGTGDGYCFPLLFRHEIVSGLGRLDHSSSFNLEMIDWARLTGFQCTRELNVGGQKLSTSHVDFAVDPVMELWAPPEWTGTSGTTNQYVTYYQYAQRGHIVLAAFRDNVQAVGPDGKYHDEIYYFGFQSKWLVQPDPLEDPSRSETFFLPGEDENNPPPMAARRAISNATATGETAFQPTVTSMLNSVFVTWYQVNAMGRVRVMGRRSLDQGAHWGEIIEVSNAGAPANSGLQFPICPTTPLLDAPDGPIWSRYSGSVALYEGTPTGTQVSSSSMADPLAITMFTSGRSGVTGCADQTLNSARWHEVNVARWR